MGSKGADPAAEQFRQVRHMIDSLLSEETCLNLKDLAVNGHDLMLLGIPAGKELGRFLQALLDAVLDETLPNEKEALLEAAKDMK